MSLISGLYFRGNPQQKPKQWGPLSAVKSSLYNNAEHLGIDPAKIELAMPFWSPGNPTNYGCKSVVTTNYGVSVKYNQFSFIPVNYVTTDYYGPIGNADRFVLFTFTPLTTSTKCIFGYGSAVTNQAFDVTIQESYIKVHAYGNTVTFSNTLYSVGIEGSYALNHKNSVISSYKNGEKKDALDKVFATTGSMAFNFGNGVYSPISYPTMLFSQCVFINGSVDDDIAAKLTDRPFCLWTRPTVSSYFDFGSTAASINCNLLAAAAQATRIIQ